MFSLLVLAFSYILGIIFYENILSFNILIWSGAIVIALIFNLIYHLFKKENFLLLSLSAIFLIYGGAFWHNYSIPEQKNNSLYYYAPQKDINIEGIILSEPKAKTDKISFDFRAELVTSPYIMSTNGISKVTVYTTDLKLAYGDRVSLNGNLKLPEGSANPGEFSYQEYLKKHGIFSLISVNSSDGIQVLEKDTLKDIYYYIYKIKNSLLSVFFQSMPSDIAALVSSLVFGADAVAIPEDIRTDFTNLGLAHVLAASGMQISLIMGTGIFIVRRFSVNRIAGAIAISFSIIFYMFLTGFPPSIMRAGVLNLLILPAVLKKEAVDGLKALILVSFALLVWSPLNLYDIGFQFSVLATFALIYAAKELDKKMDFLPPFLSEAVAMIVSAQLFVMPLQLYYFSQYSLLFLPANLIASLFVNLLTYLAVFTLSLGLIIPSLALLMGKGLFYFVSGFLYIIDYLSSLPFSVSYTARPSVLLVILSYGIIFLAVEFFKKNSWHSLLKPQFITLFFLVFISSLGLANQAIAGKKELRVTYLSVNQGDSTLIETPEGKNILIDCGQSYNFKTKSGKEISFDASERYILPYFRHKGITKIDILILSHPDSDHIGGCSSLIDNLQVKEVWDSGQSDDSRLYHELLSKILKQRINFTRVNQGFIYGESDLKLRVINQIEQNFSDKSYNNNNSIALKLNYKKNSFLFTADLEADAEQKLVDSPVDLTAQVYKAGHHGSKSSSTESFLARVRPQISIISAGKNNRFGHPHQEVLERLAMFGSDIYRTDLQGGIIVTSDGENLDIETALD